MMNKRYYIVDKNNKEIIHGYIDYEHINGFHIKPKKSIHYEGIEVGHLTLVEPDLIKKVLKRKIKRKLNTYLSFLMNIIDEDDDDSEAVELVIDDMERYKAIIINKYSKFLDKGYLTSLLKKVGYVERELQRKLRCLSLNDEMQIGRRR